MGEDAKKTLTIVGLAALIVVAVAFGIYQTRNSGAGTNVDAIQAEMKKEVPKDAKPISQQEASGDMMTMGASPSGTPANMKGPKKKM